MKEETEGSIPPGSTKYQKASPDLLGGAFWYLVVPVGSELYPRVQP